MEDIKELNDKVFNLGGYEFKIVLMQARVGDNTLNLVRINIENLVKRVKGDIFVLVLQELRNYLKEDDEVSIGSLIVNETDALGSFIPLLKIPHNAFSMQPLNELMQVAVQYQDTIVDLEETLRIAGVRKAKVERTVSHLQRSITEFQGKPVEIDHTAVYAKLLPSPKGLIPALYIEIYGKVHETRNNRDYKDLFKTHIKEMFMDFCPIEIKQKDNLQIII
jgi:hypothetical protein